MAGHLKIYFRNGINGTREDWSGYFSTMNAIKKKVESDKDGEAGVIVFDKVSVEFEYKPGTPVYTAFNTDLTNVQRYIIEIEGLKTDKTPILQFIGIADFKSLDWPDGETKISFDVLDKLSALDLLTAQFGRQTNNPFTRIGMPPFWTDFKQMGYYKHLSNYLIVTKGTTYGGTYDVVEWDHPDFGDPDQVFFEQGEVIDANGEGKKFVVKDSFLAPAPAGMPFEGKLVNWIEILHIDGNDWSNGDFNPQMICYDDLYYGKDIYYRIAGKIEAIDGLKVTSAIYEQVWGDTPFVNRTGANEFQMPLNYFSKLIDENPLGEHPLDALKILADSMQCYIYTSRTGELVVQKKGSALGTNGTTRTLASRFYKKYGNKKYFWDKLTDEVNITVNSWVMDATKESYLTGTSSLKKNTNIKSRNPFSKEVLAMDSGTNTQELLDAHAATMASGYFNFYGNRHWAYSVSLKIYNAMLEWDLLDNITIDGMQYFFASLTIDLMARTLNAELVSVESFDYDSSQAHIALNDSNESNYFSRSGGGSSTPIQIVTDITALNPLDLTNAVLKLNYKDNLKLSTDNKLDTVQDIKKTSTTIEFARIGFGGAPDSIYKIKNYGDEWTLGNVTIDGLQAIGGEVDASYKQKIYGNNWLTGNQKIDGYAAIGGAVDTNFKLKICGDQKVTGNLTVDGDIYIGGSINQVNVVDLNVTDHAIRLNKSGDNTTALDGGIEMLGAGDALLGSIKYTGSNWLSDLNFNLASGKVFKINDTEILSSTTLGDSVINSSLTKVGTLATGVWNATAINGQYLNYNTTNLKVTSNQINTIQNIATTSSPTFAQLTLSNAATVTTQAVRADRIIDTTAPLTGGGNLTADRTIVLSYNTTNLKLTTNQLNTIQDIATTSSPTFVNLTLSGRVDQQGTDNSEFGSQYILPKTNYYGNLGAINKKWLTLHAAELWVETLVAQDTIATIGGRVLVGPTTTLVSDLAAGSSTINVKHNQMINGDVVYMEAMGKVEFMRINSSYSGSAGNYTYSVIRNLDGTGANDWYAGDAMFNTGQSGNGFIDLYSLRGIKSASQAGPTIVGNVRNSTTYNDWSEHWAIGNLNNLYGYSSNTYGVGLGKYANSSSFITVDSSNGIRLRYKNSGGTVTDKITLDMSGNVYIANYLQVGGAAADVNSNTTTINGGKITTNTITLSHLNFTPVQTSNVVASINASAEGITINGSKLTINSSTTFASGYDPTGKISTGGAATDINNNTTTINGGKITTNTVTLNQLNFTPVQTSNVVASINASAEGITISGSKLTINSSTTFASGYNPTTKVPSGGAAADVNSNTTTINGGKITTNTITLSHLNFTPVQTSNVVASINATAEGITVNANRLNLTGVLAVGSAASDINNNTTTISSNKVRTGILQSNNWGYSAGSYYNLDDGTIKLGGSDDFKFSVSSSGYATITSALIANWYIRDGVITDTVTAGSEKVVINSAQKSIYIRPMNNKLKYVMMGQLNDGSSPGWTNSYGFSALDMSNRFLVRIDENNIAIAGFNFDFEKLTKGTTSVGLSFNSGSTRWIANSGKGFEVWNPTDTRLFCGELDGSGNLAKGFAWNLNDTTAYDLKLVVAGDVVSSRLSTFANFDNTTNGAFLEGQQLSIYYRTGDIVLRSKFNQGLMEIRREDVSLAATTNLVQVYHDQIVIYNNLPQTISIKYDGIYKNGNKIINF